MKTFYGLRLGAFWLFGVVIFFFVGRVLVNGLMFEQTTISVFSGIIMGWMIGDLIRYTVRRLIRREVLG